MFVEHIVQEQIHFPRTMHDTGPQIEQGIGALKGRRIGAIEIADAGKGFERWNACEFMKPRSSAPRGYGTLIMRRLMDEIEALEPHQPQH